MSIEIKEGRVLGHKCCPEELLRVMRGRADELEKEIKAARSRTGFLEEELAKVRNSIVGIETTLKAAA